jgi:hypothetical protein
MIYSLATLKPVKPCPSTKQDGKILKKAAAMLPAVARVKAAKVNRIFTFPVKKTGAIKNDTAWIYRAIIHNWVGRSFPYPGNMPMPKYASECRKSVIAINIKEIPRNIK